MARSASGSKPLVAFERRDKDLDMARQLNEAEALVRAAFAAARTRKKAGWEEMRLPVLKNRLLDLTDRQFSETEYGAEDLRQFVAMLSTIVDVVQKEGGGVVVRLRDDQMATLGPATATHPVEDKLKGSRVRQDLWRAVLDYSTGAHWLWDLETARAFRSSERPDGALILPTVRPEDLGSWRRSFVELHAETSSSEEKARLADWAGRGLTTSALPVRLRGPWNNFLKHNVVNRLREWYAAHEIPAPLDLLVSPTSPNEEALRSLVHRWVDKLEFVELLSLPIPMSAVWRDGGRNF